MKNIVILALLALISSCTGFSENMFGDLNILNKKIIVKSAKGDFTLEGGNTQIKFEYGVIAVKKPELTFLSNGVELGKVAVPAKAFHGKSLTVKAKDLGQDFDMVGGLSEINLRTYQTVNENALCYTPGICWHTEIVYYTDSEGDQQSSLENVFGFYYSCPGSRWERYSNTDYKQVFDLKLLEPDTAHMIGHFSGESSIVRTRSSMIANGPCYQ